MDLFEGAPFIRLSLYGSISSAKEMVFRFILNDLLKQLAESFTAVVLLCLACIWMLSVPMVSKLLISDSLH